MPFTPGNLYTREQIQAVFPTLAPRDALARMGQELALVLLRNNEPGWVNFFLQNPPRLNMNINKAKAEHNALIRDSSLTKHLFFSESGGTYKYLGRIRFSTQTEDAVLGRFYICDLLDPGPYVPRK